MTASLIFEGELNVDLSQNEFQTNLVPFSRLHFMITTEKKKATAPNDIKGITQNFLDAKNNYRGKVKAKKANAEVQPPTCDDQLDRDSRQHQHHRW